MTYYYQPSSSTRSSSPPLSSPISSTSSVGSSSSSDLLSGSSSAFQSSMSCCASSSDAVSITLGSFTIWSGKDMTKRDTRISDMVEKGIKYQHVPTSEEEMLDHEINGLSVSANSPLLLGGRKSDLTVSSGYNNNAWYRFVKTKTIRISKSGFIVILSLFGLAIFIFRRMNQPTPTPTEEHAPEESQAWEELAASDAFRSTKGLNVPIVSDWMTSDRTNEGFIPFPSTIYDPLYQRPVRFNKTVTQKAFSSRCADLWISQAKLCPGDEAKWRGNEPKLDVLWTWVNGSKEEPGSDWRIKVSDDVGYGMVKKPGVSNGPAVVVMNGPREGIPLMGQRNPMMGQRQGRIDKRGELGASIARHFREHDELRHSLRSIITAFLPSSLSQLHLIVNDSPSFTPSGEPLLPSEYPASTLLAQVPHWADLGAIHLSRVKPENSTFHQDHQKPILKLHPLTELFKTAINETTQLANETLLRTQHRAAREWRKSALPSFNSLAVESQLANLPSDTGDTLFALCDDFFVMRNMSVADVESPLTGPVLRFQRDLIVNSMSPTSRGRLDTEGEWRGLEYTNWLLDQRFGSRPRFYPTHVGKSISIPMLREVQAIWIDELSATTAARFRGKAPTEVQVWMLLHHYTVEKHRETLLWSFFVARHDSNHDGSYSLSERLSILSELGYAHNVTYPDDQAIRYESSRPFRRTLSTLLVPDHTYLGLPKALQTHYSFSSNDGYSALQTEYGSYPVGTARNEWPRFDARQSPSPSLDRELDDGTPPTKPLAPACVIGSLRLCFADGFLDPENESKMSVIDSFRILAYENRKCGDCFIVSLVAKSGERGLEGFLPKRTKADEKDVEIDVEVIGLNKDHHDIIDVSGEEMKGVTWRQRAVSLIQRYTYVVGETSTRFFSMRYVAPVQRDLLTLSLERPAMVALNDDIQGSPAQVIRINKVLKSWYAKEWPYSTIWEKEEPDEVDEVAETVMPAIGP